MLGTRSWQAVKPKRTGDVRDDDVVDRRHARADARQAREHLRRADQHGVVDQRRRAHLPEVGATRGTAARDERETLAHILDVGAEADIGEADRVAARLLGVARQRHGDRGDQRLARQLVEFQEVAPQGAAAGREQHVVDAAAGGLADRLHARERGRLRGDAPLRRDIAVQDRARRLGERGEVGIGLDAERGRGRARQAAQQPRDGTGLAQERAGQHAEHAGMPRPAARPAPALLRPDRRRVALRRVVGEVQQTDARHSVGQRVVQLAVHGEAPAVQALDQVDLPERPVEIHRVGVQARDEHAELALAAGIGQRRVPQVVVEVHLLEFLEVRQRPAQSHAAQSVIERRRRHRETAQVLVDLPREATRRIGRRQERLQSRDVHRRLAGFHEHEAQVEQVQRLDVWHLWSPLVTWTIWEPRAGGHSSRSPTRLGTAPGRSCGARRRPPAARLA